ncbi:MAG: TerB family tellurite resistance protein [Clostridia bacterium]|nr:TerB family tellurite resistance protein [Clostridia bacterium]
MFDLDEVCGKVEKLDPMTYAQLISELSESVMKGLTAIVGNPDDAQTLLTSLILGAVISDGKIKEQEFGLIKPLFEEAVGEEVTFEEMTEFMDAFKTGKSDYKKMIASLTNLFGAVSDDLKSDTVMLCMLVCAADGKISVREKNWLRQLIG